MEQKLTFTAYLKDEYSKRFDKLAEKTDADVKKIAKDLDKFASSGKKAARTIDEIDKRIRVLTQAKKFTLDTSAIKFARKEIAALEKEKARLEGKSGGNPFGGMMKGFAVAGLAVAAGAMIKGQVQKSIDASMEREQQRISFGVLTGNQAKGDKMLNDIVKMGEATPFEANDLIRATQTMLNFGVAQEKVLPVMQQLGDISGGNNDRFQSLALAFGQISSTGRLMGQDLLQMVNAGFNPLQEISRNTGRSMKDLKKDMEDGKISAQMVSNALQTATAAGGRYFGMMEKQSQTTAGRISTLKDNAHELAVVVGDRLKPSLDAAITGLSSMVAKVKAWVEIPASEKIKKETEQLHLLRAELGATNTSEERRKQILAEVKNIIPDIVDGTKSEKDQLNELNNALDVYIGKRTQQIALEQNKEANLKAITNYKQAQADLKTSYASVMRAVAQARMLGLQTDGMSQQEQQMAAIGFLRARIAQGYETNASTKNISTSGMGSGQAETDSDERRALALLLGSMKQNKKALRSINDNADAYREFEATEKAIKELFGPTGSNSLGSTSASGNDAATGGKDGKGGKGSVEKASSISGGQKITHLNISINNLVGGGVNVYSTTVKESAGKIKDHVVEALLTAVNDANLAAN
ncbi:MAG TPA: tape measure protein [Ferruginibacter sp.]|mgnify:CR=1 FL=1|nr:tape measure protein [Ferruginibacter sp.]HMP22171.1 tape measure protein [Ferruginibacter sp.]